MQQVQANVYGFEIEFLSFLDEISGPLSNMVLSADKKTMTLEQAISLIKAKCKEHELDQEDTNMLINEVKKMW